MPPDTPNTPCWPLMPPPQYMHLVIKSGTTADQPGTSSACGSEWCFIRCTPQGDISGGQEWYKLSFGWPELMFYCLQYTVLTFQEYFGIHCLNFSNVTPQCPWHPLNPLLAPSPIQASSSQEWYYCRSAWHVISLWVRLMFCQMYPPWGVSGDQEQYYIR